MNIKITTKTLTPIFTILALILFGTMINSAQTSALRAENLNNEAVKKADAGNFAEAIELFHQTIQIYPDYTVAYGNLGGTLYRAGRLAEAEEALQKAIELNPQFAEAYLKLGVIYTDASKYTEAVKFIKQAVKLKPDLAMAHYNLGCVLIRQEKFKEAVEAFEHAAALDANFAETYVQAGYALSRLKKYGVAIKQLEQAVQLKPNDAEAQFFLGQLYLLNSDRQSALGQYRKIALLDATLAEKLYSVIYGKMLVTRNEK